MTLGRCRILISIGLCLLLVACGNRAEWQTKGIAGLTKSLHFTLTEDNGSEVRAKDFLGHITMVYFGYTHCPDVCPNTMAKLKAAIDRLPEAQAKAVRVLFITVDPKRDGLERLRSYTAAFGPQFVGLRGNQEELQALARRYRVGYSYGTPDASGNYEVTHASAVFVFDRKGDARFMVRTPDGVNAIAADLKRLENEAA
ncbi:MAG TPA: SCO family protein [Nitrococcus sp.]|nr:SCO family protein [Nitrococcus sp.]